MTKQHVQIGLGVGWMLLGLWMLVASNRWTGVGMLLLGAFTVVYYAIQQRSGSGRAVR